MGLFFYGKLVGSSHGGSFWAMSIWMVVGYQSSEDVWVIEFSGWWQLKYALFSPLIWGRFPIWLAHIFQMGWFNHQLVLFKGGQTAGTVTSLQLHVGNRPNPWDGRVRRGYKWPTNVTLPETNSKFAPENIGKLPKRKGSFSNSIHGFHRNC